MNYRLIFAVLATLGVISTLSFAQTTDIQSMWKEKIREHMQEMIKEKWQSHRASDNTPTIAKGTSSTKIGDEVLVSGNSNQESEIHAAMNPMDTANIVIVPIQGTSEGLLLPIYVTYDFGVTWQKSEFIIQETGGGDPVLAFDADGKLYFTWLSLEREKAQEMQLSMLIASSLDGGKTWSTPDTVSTGTLITSSEGYTEGYAVDKQWMAVDKTSGLRRNSLYVVFVEMSNTDEDVFFGISMQRKQPGNDTFDKKIVRITDETFLGVQFPSIGVDSYGNIHVFCWGIRNGEEGIWHTMSKDGSTFGEIHKIAPVRLPNWAGFVPPHLPQRLAAMPQFDIDWYSTSGNTLYAVWSSNDLSTTAGPVFGEPIHVYFSRSTDLGVTWSEPLIINDDHIELSADQFHPSISVSPSGKVLVTWYDGREADKNTKVHYYAAISHDQGKTFTRNIQVSSASSNINASIQGSFGIGDYDKALSSSYYGIPIWSDGRTNDGNLNVYAAFIPFSSVTSVERIVSVSQNFTVFDPVPNPAYEFANVIFAIQRSSKITASIYNESGVKIRDIINETYNPGKHSFIVQTSDLPNGMYFLHVRSNSQLAVKKISVVR